MSSEDVKILFSVEEVKSFFYIGFFNGSCSLDILKRSRTSFNPIFTVRIAVCLWRLLFYFDFLIYVHLYVLEFSMAYIIIELVHIFV